MFLPSITEASASVNSFCHSPGGQSLEALSVKQYKLSYYKNLVIVFVIREKSCDRFVYKSSRIKKWQKFSESDRRGILATQLNHENVLRRRIWQTIMGLVIVCGLASYGVNSQAETWWSKVISYGNPQVAKIINQAARPLLISDASGINYGNVFSLSYLLQPKVEFKLVKDQTIPNIPDVFTDIFLLNPSDIWRQKIETIYNYATKVLYSDNHYLLWKLENSGRTRQKLKVKSYFDFNTM